MTFAPTSPNGVPWFNMPSVSDDTHDVMPMSRIQRSLRTRDKSNTYKAAVTVHEEVENNLRVRDRREK